MPDESKYDPARLLTFASLVFVGYLIVFVSTIIATQIWKLGEANTESWAALTGLIGWAMGVASGLYNNRFGSTTASASKDSTIEQQARTAAVIAGSLPPTPTPAAPLRTETINVEAENAVITEAPVTPAPTNEEK